ncbi:MAG TPA: Clp protease N-terminal domain-containing protein [Acidimicrobiales bacterium]|nr:Clp protease N-terminal domain-containing protein [Acidimicrobiales bacterium]
MFERFTDRARTAVTLAQQEARSLGHGYVGTEHLLLALVRQGDGVAARVLDSAGVSADAVRSDVLEIVGRGPSGTAPGAEDLVGPADTEALRAIGIDVDSIRERIEESFGPGALERARRPRRGRRLQLRRPRRRGVPCSGSPWPLSGHMPFTPRSKKVLELSLREAIRLRHNYIGTEHILLGLLREGEGLAAMVLVKQGLGLDDLRRRVLDAIGKVA